MVRFIVLLYHMKRYGRSFSHPPVKETQGNQLVFYRVFGVGHCSLCKKIKNKTCECEPARGGENRAKIFLQFLVLQTQSGQLSIRGGNVL
jgi:hypothetical protein